VLEQHTTRSSQRLLVYTDDPDEGGVALYNHALLCGLSAAGFSVGCAQTQVSNSEIEEQRSRGVTHYWLPYNTRRDPQRNLSGRADAIAVFDAARPDLVIFTDCSTASLFAAKSVAAQRRLPYMIVEHFVAPSETFSPEAAWLLHFQKDFYRQARAVVAVSTDNLHWLRADHGLHSNKGEIIFYGRPNRFFEPRSAENRQRIRRDLAIPADATVCITTARMAPVKGFAHQLAAMPALLADPAWQHLHFIWSGDGPLRPEIEMHLRKLGITDRVHMVGQRNDIAALLDASDMFVLPSHREGMPLSIMEAMAKGLPVAASAVSGIPEELGDTGKLLPDPNSDPAATARELSATILEWTRDATLRNRAGESCRNRANLLFREDRMVAATIDVIDRCLLPAGDYVSPGLRMVRPDACFPNLGRADAKQHSWPYLRSEIPHNFYCDARLPGTGFLCRDEAVLVYNLALPFCGKAGLEIGCWLGWSACHVAMAGVQLDVVDPVLSNPQFLESVRASLTAAGVSNLVNLVGEPSPQGVDRLARASGRRWNFFFIDGNHDAPHPVFDAAVTAEYASEDAIVVFHDLASPDVAQGLEYLRLRGWNTLVYQTMQIIGVAWRGRVRPPVHLPDPDVHWHLPKHLSSYKVSGLATEVTSQAMPTRR